MKQGQPTKYSRSGKPKTATEKDFQKMLSEVRQIEAAVNRAPKQRKPKPQPQKASNPTGMTKTFREQLPDGFLGSTTFALNSVSVNPGDVGVFPRLALIAQAFTKYRFKSLRAQWQPLGSAFATNNQTGEVCLNFNPNWYSANATSMSQAASRKPSVVGKAWEVCSVHCTKDILSPWRYLRSVIGSGGHDMRLTDILCELAVSATPNSSALGYLVLDGEVEFAVDYVASLVTAPRTNKIFPIQFNAQTVSSGVSAYLSNAGTSVMPNSLNSGVVQESVSEWHLWGGNFLIIAQAYITGTTITQGYLDITISGAVGSWLTPLANFGGSTFSASAYTCNDIVVCTVSEDGSPAIFKLLANFTGTGTLSIAATMYIMVF
jgi:hypothetical protein